MKRNPIPDWTPPERWRGFNLLGLFRAPTEGLAPDPRVAGCFPEWEFEALEEWGFDFARLPVDYRTLVAGDDWTNLVEEKLALLDEAIELGRKHGVHVQVALHRIPGYCILDETEAFPLGPSPVALAWMEHCLELWKSENLGWALWNLRGAFGVLDSGRADIRYEDWRGHALDRAMLDLLRRF